MLINRANQRKQFPLGFGINNRVNQCLFLSFLTADTLKQRGIVICHFTDSVINLIGFIGNNK